MEIVIVFLWVFSLVCSVLSQTPLQLCTVGRATHYVFNGVGGCGFGDISPYIIAPNEEYYNGSLECGQCYEVTGPFGTVTAIVGDYCPVQGNERWCSGDMVHFDLRDSTFSQIAQSSWGVIEMNYRKVACSVTGPVQVKIDSSTNPSYLNIYPFNYRVGVLKVEIQENGGSWITLNRQIYNRFQYNPGRNLNYPINVRLTSIYNTQVTAVLQGNSPGSTVDADGQFPTPSQVGSSTQCPVVREPVIYSEGLNDGGTHGTAMHWSNVSWGLSSTDWLYTVNPHSGTYCLKTTISAWGGLSFWVSAAISSSEIVALDFWMRASTSYNNMIIYWNDASSNSVNLPQVGTSWTHVTLPVTQWPSPIPSSINKITFQNRDSTSPELYFDEIQLILNITSSSPPQSPVPSTTTSSTSSSPSPPSSSTSTTSTTTSSTSTTSTSTSPSSPSTSTSSTSTSPSSSTSTTSTSTSPSPSSPSTSTTSTTTSYTSTTSTSTSPSSPSSTSTSSTSTSPSSSTSTTSTTTSSTSTSSSSSPGVPSSPSNSNTTNISTGSTRVASSGMKTFLHPALFAFLFVVFLL